MVAVHGFCKTRTWIPCGPLRFTFGGSCLLHWKHSLQIEDKFLSACFLFVCCYSSSSLYENKRKSPLHHRRDVFTYRAAAFNGIFPALFFSIMKPFMIKNILVSQWLILRPFIIRAWACNNKQERFNCICICIWICARRLNFAALVVVVWPANKEKSSLESDWESKRACFFYGIFYGSPLCREKICKNSSLWIKIQCKISLRQILSRKRIIFSTTSFHLNV